MGAAIMGLIGRKLGMTQVYDAEGVLVPVTVIQAGPCTVVGMRRPERDGYAAAQIGFGPLKAERVDGLLGRLQDVQEPLVGANLELLA